MSEHSPVIGRIIYDNIVSSYLGISALYYSADVTFAIYNAVEEILASYRSGGKVLVCGNGGSAAQAQHMVGELVGRYMIERSGLRAIALTADTSVLTAIGNDYGYGNIFARQIKALGDSCDVLIALSTSGTSPNILRALDTAKEMGLHRIGLMGEAECPMIEKCSTAIRVPATATPLIQELHMIVIHAICGAVEHEIFRGGSTLEPKS